MLRLQTEHSLLTAAAPVNISIHVLGIYVTHFLSDLGGAVVHPGRRRRQAQVTLRHTARRVPVLAKSSNVQSTGGEVLNKY